MCESIFVKLPACHSWIQWLHMVPIGDVDIPSTKNPCLKMPRELKCFNCVINTVTLIVYTECFTDLDKLKLVKFYHSGKVLAVFPGLGFMKIFITASAASKNYAWSKNGQK